MNKELFLKIVNLLAVKVTFHLNGEVCTTIVTKNSKYFIPNKNNNFFDLIKKKNIYIDKILAYEMLFCNHISMPDLLNDKFIDDKKIQDHFEWNFNCILEHKKNIKREMFRLTKEIKNLTLSELLDYCNDSLFFTPTKQTREDILVEIKNRKKFLLTTVDHGIFTKLLNVFEIADEDFLKNDSLLVVKCKEKWKNKIKNYINKAKCKLNKELEENKDDTDLVLEVEEISKILDNIEVEFEEKEFKSPKEIASYWPDLLKPTPIYVLENNGE
jgi:hypothetical protein